MLFELLNKNRRALMKKSGFTLAELLISLGITGVITALMATALVTLQPDQKKAIYLRNYDALTKAVKALAGNSRLFPVCQDNLNCQAHPLFNTATGIDSRFASIGAGDGKLCKGLSYMMNGQMLPQLNCENQPIAYSDGNWTPSFRTYRTEWLVSTLRELNGSSATYQSDVYFDLNGPEGPNCVYSDSCQNPDRFKFLVAADGTVIPADPVGQEYILKRKNWRKSRLSIAEDSTTKENLLANLRAFNLTPCHEESGGENVDDGYDDHDEHYTLIPCGAKLDGRIVNCYTRKSFYQQIFRAKYGEPIPEYPILLDPQEFEFDYPVASNLTIISNADHGASLSGKRNYSSDTGNVFPYNTKFVTMLQECIIGAGETTGVSNKFYIATPVYSADEISITRYAYKEPIKYPTSFEEIYNYNKRPDGSNIYFSPECLSIESDHTWQSNKENWVHHPYGWGVGYYGAFSRVTPIIDDKYIYLEKAYKENDRYYSDGVGEVYYIRYGGILNYDYDEHPEVPKLVNDIWNIDSPYTNRHKKYIKEQIRNGKDVSIIPIIMNSGYYEPMSAKWLDFTKK